MGFMRLSVCNTTRNLTMSMPSVDRLIDTDRCSNTCMQVLRHIYALAVQPRCVEAVDVNTQQLVYVPLTVATATQEKGSSSKQQAVMKGNVATSSKRSLGCGSKHILQASFICVHACSDRSATTYGHCNQTFLNTPLIEQLVLVLVA